MNLTGASCNDPRVMTLKARPLLKALGLHHVSRVGMVSAGLEDP
jgi:hypothetical protein